MLGYLNLFGAKALDSQENLLANIATHGPFKTDLSRLSNCAPRMHRIFACDDVRWDVLDTVVYRKPLWLYVHSWSIP